MKFRFGWPLVILAVATSFGIYAQSSKRDWAATSHSGKTLVQDPPACDVILPEIGFDKRGNLIFLPWTNGLVYYQFEAGVTQQNRERMRREMDAWEARVNVRFLPRTSQSNYIQIRNSTVNSSFVGMQGGQQILNLSNWENTGVILHELGHALGLHHEHQRQDRNTFVTVATSSNCASHNLLDLIGTAVFTYDFESIMHYGRNSCGPNTLLPKPTYSHYLPIMGQRNHISRKDATALLELYPFPSKPVFKQDELFLRAEPGSNAASTSFSVHNRGNGTVSYSMTANGSFIVDHAPTGGTATFQQSYHVVHLDTSGLAQGLYQGEIRLWQGSQLSDTLPITLSVAPIDLTFEPHNVHLNLTMGQTELPVDVWIFNPLLHPATLILEGDEPWLDVPRTISFPFVQGNVFVTNVINAASYGVGWHRATLVWEWTNTVGHTVRHVTPAGLGVFDPTVHSSPPEPGVITTDLNEVTLEVLVGENPDPIDMNVWNGSSGGDFNYQFIQTPGWCTVSSASGGTFGTLPMPHQLQLQTSHLPIGEYRWSLKMIPTDPAVTDVYLPVLIQIRDPQPVIGLNPTVIEAVKSEQAGPFSTPIQIWNAGTGVLNFQVSADVGWVQPSPIAGQSSGAGDPVQIDLSIFSNTLGRGDHSGNLSIAGSSGVTPQEVPINLRILAADLNGVGFYWHDPDFCQMTGSERTRVGHFVRYQNQNYLCP